MSYHNGYCVGSFFCISCHRTLCFHGRGLFSVLCLAIWMNKMMNRLQVSLSALSLPHSRHTNANYLGHNLQSNLNCLWELAKLSGLSLTTPTSHSATPSDFPPAQSSAAESYSQHSCMRAWRMHHSNLQTAPSLVVFVPASNIIGIAGYRFDYSPPSILSANADGKILSAQKIQPTSY